MAQGKMGRGRTGRLIVQALGRSKSKLLEALFSSLFINVLALAVPVFMLQIYDRVVFHAGLTTLQGLVVGMAVVILFDGLLRLGRARLFQRIGLDIDIDIGRALFEKLMKLPMRVLELRTATSWQILFRDVDAVRGALSGPSMGLLLDLPFAALFLLAILWLAPPLAGVILAMLPLFLILAWWSGTTASRLNDAERSEAGRREALVNEIIVGRATVKSLALAGKLQPVWEQRHADTIIASLNRGTAGDSHMTLSHMMSLVTTVAMTCVGALLILEQNLTIGALIASNMLGARMVAPIAGLVGQWKTLQNSREAARRIDEVLAIEDDRATLELPMKRPSGAFALEDVTFRYDQNGDPAIDKISGTIGPNGLHCIVGKNGSGKSTLFKLLAGLYQPESGRILLDGADIAQFPRRQLAGWVGYMPQEIVMFSGSVKDNIAMGVGDIGDEDVLRAAERAGAHEAIIQLPDGYDSDIGEAGGRLSGGQRRRIAAARALVSDPPVLLMDEPSGDLDGDAEFALARGLKALSQDRTVIVATHSPKLLNAADTILVMDQGRVAMAGRAPDILDILRGQAQERRDLAKAAATKESVPEPKPAAE